MRCGKSDLVQTTKKMGKVFFYTGKVKKRRKAFDQIQKVSGKL